MKQSSVTCFRFEFKYDAIVGYL